MRVRTRCILDSLDEITVEAVRVETLRMLGQAGDLPERHAMNHTARDLLKAAFRGDEVYTAIYEAVRREAIRSLQSDLTDMEGEVREIQTAVTASGLAGEAEQSRPGDEETRQVRVTEEDEENAI